MKLFCDCKTDTEKANFFLSGRVYESGVIATALQNDVAMAYSRCAAFSEEITQLRTRIAELEAELAACREEGDTLRQVVKIKVSVTIEKE